MSRNRKQPGLKQTAICETPCFDISTQHSRTNLPGSTVNVSNEPLQSTVPIWERPQTAFFINELPPPDRLNLELMGGLDIDNNVPTYLSVLQYSSTSVPSSFPLELHKAETDSVEVRVPWYSYSSIPDIYPDSMIPDTATRSTRNFIRGPDQNQADFHRSTTYQSPIGFFDFTVTDVQVSTSRRRRLGNSISNRNRHRNNHQTQPKLLKIA
ncbi:uncharacterized protein RSE6_01022 [Rhynchosporium secalis]|uniref:Uncharacterized protein n=1 Tax=Rhynchosporium secalis TaxID=38038 RepID=A0A1E1LWU3_RHYSE|nr:uncharacterized protein RSE6_01022 [Rhynchosporium secalis]